MTTSQADRASEQSTAADVWQRVAEIGIAAGEMVAHAVENVGRLVDDVKQVASGKREAVGRLVAQVRDRSTRYAAGVTGARQQSAESAQTLLATLTQAAEGDVVSSLATATLNTSEAAVSRALRFLFSCWSRSTARRLLSDSFWLSIAMALEAPSRPGGQVAPLHQDC